MSMKKEQILKKAIEKAVENGWKNTFHEEPSFKIIEVDESPVDWVLIEWSDGSRDTRHLNAIIFEKLFAKAFWGDEKTCHYCGKSDYEESDYSHSIHCNFCDTDQAYYESWRYHIQQLALAEDRLEYIGKFI